MQLLKDYFALQQQIHDYFGYEEDWVTIPLDDATDMYWRIIGGEGRGGSVQFAESIEDLPSDYYDSGMYYENEIYTQRFLPKWVYRGAEYTMICVDTHTDGNRYLQVFDNSKEVKDDSEAEA
jgi:hypothetical protein